MSWVDTTQTFYYDTQVPSASSSSVVKLSLAGEQFQWSIDNREFQLPLSQIIGVRLVDPKVWNSSSSTGSACCGSNKELELATASLVRESSFWMIFAYDIPRNKRGDIESTKFRRILFSNSDGGTSAKEIVDRFNQSLGYFAPSLEKKKILLIANPFGGTNKALSTYHKIVLPLLQIAGLEDRHELIKTTHRNHAMEIGRNLDVENYRCAATISGDGVFHELMNGILSRPDWKESSRLPLGIIGSGTSNALGQNLDIANQHLATLNLIKCKTQKMDVLSILQNGSVTYSHLLVAWTLIADVDIESEKFRKLGSLRMAVMVLIRLMKFRSYKGKIYLLPEGQEEKFRLQNSIDDSEYPGPKTNYIKPGGKDYENWPTVIDSYFQYFLAVNMPWIATDYLACPYSEIDNGKIDLLFCKKISRSSVLASFLDAERGVGMTLPCVEHFRVKAFVLEPGSYKKNNSSSQESQSNILENVNLNELIMDVSGERYPYSQIQVEVLPCLINIIAPAWLDSERWKKNFMKEYPPK